MRKLLVVCLVACGIASAPMRAFACSCTTASFRVHLDASSVAFVGTASSTVANAATFDVEKVFKGDVGRSVSIATEGPCAVAFAPGTRYVVFARGDAASLTTTLCSGTSEDFISAESSLKVIRAYAPLPHSSSPEPFALKAPTPGGSRVMPIAFAIMMLFGCVAGLVRYSPSRTQMK
ncbi:MAG: hypothetical protein ACYDCC_03240 [Actinomycetota bacterium]